MDAKRRGVLVGLALLGSVGVLGGCSDKPRLPDYLYRLTVEVDTPQGLRTGSSVIQVASSVTGPYALRSGAVSTQVTGEAVAVDLPGGKVLFALLSKPGSAEGANTFAFDALMARPWVGWEEYVRDVNRLVERRDIGALPPSAYPMLVTFGNNADPKTVELIDPDDLAVSFGPGVKLRRITVQMTDAPVTWLLKKRLRWLANWRGELISAEINDPIDKRRLSSVNDGSFIMEVSK